MGVFELAKEQYLRAHVMKQSDARNSKMLVVVRPLYVDRALECMHKRDGAARGIRLESRSPD